MYIYNKKKDEIKSIEYPEKNMNKKNTEKNLPTRILIV